MTIQNCSHCEGTHYGSTSCPYLCPTCGLDIRPEGDCKCSPEDREKMVKKWPKKISAHNGTADTGNTSEASLRAEIQKLKRQLAEHEIDAGWNAAGAQIEEENARLSQVNGKLVEAMKDAHRLIDDGAEIRAKSLLAKFIDDEALAEARKEG